jgi:hypothetical protein
MNLTKKKSLRCNTSTTTIRLQYYHTIASAVLQDYYSVNSLLLSQYYNNCTTTKLLQYYDTTQNDSLLCSPDTIKDSLPKSNVAVVSLHLKEILLVGLILKNPYLWDP